MLIGIQATDSAVVAASKKYNVLRLTRANLKETIAGYQGKIDKLRVLECLSEADFVLLLDFLKACRDVKQLDLSCLSKSFLCREVLHHVLREMLHLEALYLVEMKLSATDIKMLEEFFISLAVTHLSLQGNDLGDAGVRKILDYAEQMHNLKFLNISYNSLSPTGCDYVVKFLQIKKISVSVAGNHMNEVQALIFAQNRVATVARSDAKNTGGTALSASTISEPSMTLGQQLEESVDLHASMERLIYGQANDNKSMSEFWQVFLAELSDFYLQHSVVELFNKDLSGNLLISDFAEITVADSFAQMIAKFAELHQKKKFLSKTMQVLGSENIDFRNEDISSFRARIVLQLIKISSEVTQHYNATFEVFRDIQAGIHKFLSSGIILALKQERKDLFDNLNQVGECNTTDEFIKYLELMQDCVSQYRDLHLTWHDDFNLDEFNSAANKVKVALKNKDDDRVIKVFAQVAEQFKQEYSAFTRNPTFRELGDAGKITLQIEAMHLRYSDIVGQINARAGHIKQVFIICTGTFLLDCNIVLHGINLTICSNFTYLTPNVTTIDLSPHFIVLSDGKNGRSGIVAGADGQAFCGENGTHGLGGDASGNFKLITRGALHIAQRLQVIANGNHGSRGGNGGDGVAGTDGKDGNHAEMPRLDGVDHEEDFIGYRKGGDGTPGTRGGDSGSPGAGGLGGAGGYIHFFDLAIFKQEIKNGKCGRDGDSGLVGTPGVGGMHGKNRPDLVKVKRMKKKWGLPGKGWAGRKVAGHVRDEDTEKYGRFDINPALWGRSEKGYKRGFRFPPIIKSADDDEFHQTMYAEHGAQKLAQAANQNRQSIAVHANSDILAALRACESAINADLIFNDFATACNGFAAMIGDNRFTDVRNVSQRSISVLQIENQAMALHNEYVAARFAKSTEEKVNYHAEVTESVYQIDTPTFDLYGVNKFSILQNNYFLKNFHSLESATLNFGELDDFSAEIDLKTLRQDIDRYNYCRTSSNLCDVLKTVIEILNEPYFLSYYLASSNPRFFVNFGELISSLSGCHRYLKRTPLLPNELVSNGILKIVPYPFISDALNDLYSVRGVRLRTKQETIEYARNNFGYKCFLAKTTGLLLDASNLVCAREEIIAKINQAVGSLNESSSRYFLMFLYKLLLGCWGYYEGFSRNDHHSLRMIADHIIKHPAKDIDELKDLAEALQQKDYLVYKLVSATDRLSAVYNSTPQELVCWERILQYTRSYMLNIKPLHKSVVNSWNNALSTMRTEFYQDTLAEFEELLADYNVSDKKDQVVAINDLFDLVMEYADAGNFFLAEKLFTQMVDKNEDVFKTYLACMIGLRGYNGDLFTSYIKKLHENTSSGRIASEFNKINYALQQRVDLALESLIADNLNHIIERGLGLSKPEVIAEIYNGTIPNANFVEYLKSRQFAALTHNHYIAITPYINKVIINMLHKWFKIYSVFDSAFATWQDWFNFRAYFTEQKLWDFIASPLFNELFTANLYDFGRIALYDYCENNYKQLLHVVDDIFTANICHSFDLDRLDILRCLYPIINIARYRESKHSHELSMIFKLFKHQPLRMVVEFITALHRCDDELIEILINQIVLASTANKTHVSLSSLYEYVLFFATDNVDFELNAAEMASVKQAINYVNSRLSQAPGNQEDKIRQIEAGLAFVDRFNNVVQRFGDNEAHLAYVIALRSIASEDLQMKMLADGADLKKIENEIIMAFMLRFKQILQLDHFTHYLEQAGLSHYQEIIDIINLQVKDLANAILATKNPSLIVGMQLWMQILSPKLVGHVKIEDYRAITEVMPLIINAPITETTVASLQGLDLLAWPKFLYSAANYDLINDRYKLEQDQAHDVREALQQQSFTIYAHKALNRALQSVGDDKITYSEFINILKILASADVSMIDSVHLFKEASLRNWLVKVQLFDVCKLIRQVNVEDMNDYATINGVFYHLLSHDKMAYADVVRILNILIAKSISQENRGYLAKIAEAIYFSALSADKIVHIIEDDIKNAVVHIKAGDFTTGERSALSNAELIAVFKEKNQNQQLASYLPVEQLESMLAQIINRGKELFEHIKNIDEFAERIQEIEEFKVLFSIVDHDPQVREEQYRCNLVPILSCLVALYAKAKFDEHRDDVAYVPEMPRNNQILSVIISTYSAESAKMQEIKTGEGKTLIVALTAAAFAVKKYKVDILTSNRGLAEEGEHKSARFFRYMQLACDRCCRVDDAEANKQAFGKNIVYGTIDAFQNMILENRLRDACIEFNERYQDPVQLLADEADSVMVDRAGHMRYNSANHPYFKLIDNLLTVVLSTVLGERHHLAMVADKEPIFASIAESINFQIRENKVSVPVELRDFCLSSTKSWAKSAFSALHMANLDNFIITKEGTQKSEQILIMDKRNGYEEYSTKWMYALTQFIEMINGLAKSEVSLKSNFISNCAFFKRYKHRVCGYTGTVGDNYTIEKYRELYGLNTFIVPSFRKSNLQLLSCDVVCDPSNNQDQWLNKIEMEIDKICHNQPIELVCENVANAQMLEKRLLEKQNKVSDAEKIAIYPYYIEKHAACIDDINKQEIDGNKGIIPRQCIITTNRGGRGTDIYVNHMQAPYGLHVMLTFVPETLRDSMQIIGRTGRNGNPGTASYVVNLQNADCTKGSILNFLEAEAIRDDRDRRRLDDDVYIKLSAFELEESLNGLYIECHKELVKILTEYKYLECSLHLDQQHLILENIAIKWSLWLNEFKEEISNIARDIGLDDNRAIVLQQRSDAIYQKIKARFDGYMEKVRGSSDLFGDVETLQLESHIWLKLSDIAYQLELYSTKEEEDKIKACTNPIKISEIFKEKERKESHAREQFRQLGIYNAINLREPTGAAHLRAATLGGKERKKEAIYHLKEARHLLLNQFQQINSGKESFNLITKYLNRTGSILLNRADQLSDHEKIIAGHLSIIDYIAGKKLNVNDIRKMVIDVIDPDPVKQKECNEQVKQLRQELIDLMIENKFVLRNKIRKKWRDSPEKNAFHRGYGKKFNLVDDLSSRIISLSELINKDVLRNYILEKSKQDHIFNYDDIAAQVKTYEGFIAQLKKLNIIAEFSKHLVAIIDMRVVPKAIFSDKGIDIEEKVKAIIEKFNLHNFQQKLKLVIPMRDIAVLAEIGCAEFYAILKEKNYLQEDVECYRFNTGVDFSGYDFGIYGDSKFFDPNANRDLNIAGYLEFIRVSFDNHLLSSEILYRRAKEAELFMIGYLHGQDILKDKFLAEPVFSRYEAVKMGRNDGSYHEHSERGDRGEREFFDYRLVSYLPTKFRVSESELQALYSQTISCLHKLKTSYSLHLVDYHKSNLLGALDIDYLHIGYFTSLGLDRFLTLNVEQNKKWKLAATLLALLAVCEIVIGCILVYTGAVPLGMFLINEGVSDLLYSYSVFMTEQFDFEQYMLHKAISMVVNAVSVGIQAPSLTAGAKSITFSSILTNLAVSHVVGQAMDYLAQETIYKAFDRMQEDLKRELLNRILGDLKDTLASIATCFDGHKNAQNNIDEIMQSLYVANQAGALREKIMRDIEGKLVGAIGSIMKAIIANTKATRSEQFGYRCLLVHSVRILYNVIRANADIQAAINSVTSIKDHVIAKVVNYQQIMQQAGFIATKERIFGEEFVAVDGGKYKLKRHYENIERQMKDLVNAQVDMFYKDMFAIPMGELSACVTQMILDEIKNDKSVFEQQKQNELNKIKDANDKHAALEVEHTEEKALQQNSEQDKKEVEATQKARQPIKVKPRPKPTVAKPQNPVIGQNTARDVVVKVKQDLETAERHHHKAVEQKAISAQKNGKEPLFKLIKDKYVLYSNKYLKLSNQLKVGNVDFDWKSGLKIIGFSFIDLRLGNQFGDQVASLNPVQHKIDVKYKHHIPSAKDKSPYIGIDAKAMYTLWSVSTSVNIAKMHNICGLDVDLTCKSSGYLGGVGGELKAGFGIRDAKLKTHFQVGWINPTWQVGGSHGCSVDASITEDKTDRSRVTLLGFLHFYPDQMMEGWHKKANQHQMNEHDQKPNEYAKSSNFDSGAMHYLLYQLYAANAAQKGIEINPSDVNDTVQCLQETYRNIRDTSFKNN